MKQHEATYQYRLHHLPFLVMWVAAFGVAWLGLFVTALLWNDAKRHIEILSQVSSWIYTNARWIDGVGFALGLGAFLALVQPWLMRWRYGFVPRYWRITTLVGAMLSGSFFSEFIYNNGYYDANGTWMYPNPILPILVWFSALSLIQTLALWPVVRRAWLYPFAGFGAAAIAILAGMIFSPESMSQTNMIFFGSVAQALFSGGMFLWLMRDYRVEAVAKRDEKAKGSVRLGLHPISFIGLWMMAHLFGWVALFSLAVMYTMLSQLAPFIGNMISWIFNAQWLNSGVFALVIGGVTALAQPWLMEQQSGYRPRWWLRLSILAWTVSGWALWEFVAVDNNVRNSFNDFPMLLVWFGLPTLVQSFALWRDLRGAWLYALSGAVSAVLAYFVYTQFDWSYSASMYAIILGAGLQAILTGTAFLSITVQNRQTEAATTVEQPSVELQGENI